MLSHRQASPGGPMLQADHPPSHNHSQNQRRCKRGCRDPLNPSQAALLKDCRRNHGPAWKVASAGPSSARLQPSPSTSRTVQRPPVPPAAGAPHFEPPRGPRALHRPPPINAPPPFRPPRTSTPHHDRLDDGASSSDEVKSRTRNRARASRDVDRDYDREERTSRPDKGPPRLLFDPRRHDALAFSAAKRPGSGGPPQSASGTSMSDSKSIGSAMTMTSASSVASGQSRADGHALDLDGGSTMSGAGGGGGGGVVHHLRVTYREIQRLEARLQEEQKASQLQAMREQDDSTARTVRGREARHKAQEAATVHDDDYWARLVQQHQSLAETHLNFLEIALDPRIPVGMHILPQKYNIPARLWQIAFHQLLERMRHAITTPSSAAMAPNLIEQWTDFIYFAYQFYSNLHEKPAFGVFRSAWIEQLGDLARYRMAVAGIVARSTESSAPRRVRRRRQLDEDEGDEGDDEGDVESLGRIDEDDDESRRGPSIGVAALGDWDLEEQETWRRVARDWYGQGVAETPGNGRLQHHLALLSREDELRTLYHYVKSLGATHPYVNARESILPFFDFERQTKRTRPDVPVEDLFIALHGMLFTRIQLDDFEDVLARLIEKFAEGWLLISKGDDLTHDGVRQAAVSDVKWQMMGVINVSSILQYGVEDGYLRSTIGGATDAADLQLKAKAVISDVRSLGPQATVLQHYSAHAQSATAEVSEVAAADSTSDEDEDAGFANGARKLSRGSDVPDNEGDAPTPFVLAAKLAFAMLRLTLRYPRRPDDSSFSAPCPYFTVMLTFLGSLAQHPRALNRLEHFVPWEQLADLFNTIPDKVEFRADAGPRLSGLPLPEDWLMRGQDWVGRHLYARGFYKPRTLRAKEAAATSGLPDSEADVISADAQLVSEPSLGDVAGINSEAYMKELHSQRWRRIAVTAAWLVKAVPGFSSSTDDPIFSVVEPLRSRIAAWQTEERAREVGSAGLPELEGAWSSDDEADASEDSEEEEEFDHGNVEEIRALKMRRRELRSLIRAAKAQPAPSAPAAVPRPILRRSRRKPTDLPRRRLPQLNVTPGFTVLVFDTNVMLSSLDLFRQLLDSGQWTMVVPLAVITELDGLRLNQSSLGNSAAKAIAVLESCLATHGKQLKIQTSHGNYLTNLAIRYEAIDFSSSSGRSRSMDDIILRAVAWQRDHFVNKPSHCLPSSSFALSETTAKVVLITLDRNLRLKARARELDAADDRDFARILQHQQVLADG